MGVLLPNYPEENLMKGENVPNFTGTGTSDGTSSNVFQTLQDLLQKQYQCQYEPFVPTTTKMPHAAENAEDMAQMTKPTTSFRTTTPSTSDTMGMSLKQANPVHVHHNTSWSGPPAHCAHVHKSTLLVCKPGELIVLRKVKHLLNGRTSVTRLPLTKQEILSHYSGCFEGKRCFPGELYKFHLNPEYKPA